MRTALSRSSNSPRYFGPGDHRAEVERDQAAALQRVRHVTGDQPLGQALDDGGLAHPGLADQHRVVLGPAGEHLDDPADLGVPADDRVELALAGLFGEIDAVLIKRRRRGLGFGAGHPLAAAGVVEGPGQHVGLDPEVGEDLARIGVDGGQRDQQVLRGDVRVPELLGAGLGVGEHPGERAGQLRLTDRRALRRRQLGDRTLRRGIDDGGVGAGGRDQRGDGVAGDHQQRMQQVRRFGVGIARGEGIAQRGRDGVATLDGELVGIHRRPLSVQIRS